MSAPRFAPFGVLEKKFDLTLQGIDSCQELLAIMSSSILTAVLSSRLVLMLLLSLVTWSLAGQAVVLKDGSVFKGQVVEDSEHIVRVVILSGDTLSLSHKYVDKLITEITFREDYLGGTGIVKHQTEGFFLNAEIFARPYAVSLGKRVTDNWNFGGTIFYIHQGFDQLVGIGAFSRHYFGSDLYTSRFFIDAMLGVSRRNERLSFVEEFNRYPPTGAISFGIQLPSKRTPRFFFKVGAFFHWNESRFVGSGSNSDLVKETNLAATIQFSALAIQF